MMKLVRVDDSTYVNVGDGVITTVMANDRGSSVNFVSGKYASFDMTLDVLVARLRGAR